MEINRALNIIFKTYDHFANLPDNMSSIINKVEFNTYFQANEEIDSKTIETFLNLIFDENEEDRENIPRTNFHIKYESLLKIINEDDEEDDIIIKNDNSNTKTPQKDTGVLVELGSPILIKDSNKIENDTSIEAIELFKEIKFKKEIVKKVNYDSIVRPSNNFKLKMGTINQSNNNNNANHNLNPNSNSNPIISDDNKLNEIKDNDPNQGELQQSARDNNFQLPKVKFDFNFKKPYRSNHYLNHNPTRFTSGLTNSPNKAYSIQQKLQDVYYQIHRPTNDYNQQLPISPLKSQSSKVNHLYQHDLMAPTTGVMNSNSPILNEDYFAHIYRSIHPSNGTNSVKSLGGKINQLMKKEGYQNYTHNRSNKVSLHQKFEGLNKMLNGKSNYMMSERILNEDDFITLEDKMTEFERIKKGTFSSNSKYKEKENIGNKSAAKRYDDENNDNNADANDDLCRVFDDYIHQGDLDKMIITTPKKEIEKE